MNLTDVVVGCDPEVFVRNRETGEFVSGHGLIPGTKTDPHLVDHGMVQVDGMALEFGIDPAPDSTTFYNNIQAVLEQLRGMLPDELELVATPTAEFTQEVMDAQPPEALELGCEPDYNCYTQLHNPRPNATGMNFRSGGGHVHIGLGEGFDINCREYIKTCSALVAELDYTLGIPSLAWDTDTQRRQLYGAPGAFRPKPYGLEYRSLSNRWLGSEETTRFVFDGAIAGVRNLLSDRNHIMGPIGFYGGQLALTAQEVIERGLAYIGKDMYVQQ